MTVLPDVPMLFLSAPVAAAFSAACALVVQGRGSERRVVAGAGLLQSLLADVAADAPARHAALSPTAVVTLSHLSKLLGLADTASGQAPGLAAVRADPRSARLSVVEVNEVERWLGDLEKGHGAAPGVPEAADALGRLLGNRLDVSAGGPDDPATDIRLLGTMMNRPRPWLHRPASPPEPGNRVIPAAPGPRVSRAPRRSG